MFGGIIAGGGAGDSRTPSAAFLIFRVAFATASVAALAAFSTFARASWTFCSTKLDALSEASLTCDFHPSSFTVAEALLILT